MGIAWLTGLAVGFRDAGIDLALADRIVGTSAGAIVGTVLAAGGDPASLLRPPAPDAPPVHADPAVLGNIFTVMVQNRGQDPAEVRRKIGELALKAETGAPAVHVARMSALAGVSDWPAGDLVVTAVNATTGEFQPWTKDSGVSLADALASSTCVPGVFPPIPINGVPYIDGGIRSSINADLALPADLVLILEPLAHMFPRARTDRDLGSATEISVVPDPAAITAFGPDLFGAAALLPAYEAGVRQSAEAAARLKEFWPAR